MGKAIRVGLCLLPLVISFLFAACGTDPSNGGGGINSAPGVTDRFNAVTVHSSTFASSTASCHAGEQMLSGGWAVNTPAYQADKVERGGISHTIIDEYFIAASYPSSANSWTVTFTNQPSAGYVGDVLGIVHVECMSKGKAATIVSQSGDTNSGNSLTVNCPQGTKLTGGGYRLTNLSQSNLASIVIDFETSQPLNLTSWGVTTDYSIGNLNHFGNNVAVYGVCASNLNVTLGKVTSATAPGATKSGAATLGSAQAACPGGASPVGAGYHKTKFDPRAFPITLFYPSYGSNPQSWAVNVYALPPLTIDSPPITSGGTLNVLPLCASLSA
ncbi:hypothetical protein [Tengunoibacter tsumagoiensis]|uniref:Uncharacterized protein n=1 Tax=Tengunoibacter tsumagoiensis TaxID=2014871 RepID=A0A401ZUY8_9CHLR|nr:hypothetical protein [Tengunoibacter tsumagoiensis]GCE10606.1 hypothetical protein KTT_04650 [Tengunoibacter tsumagoiensis]